MGKIRVEIFGSSVNFTKLFIDLDNRLMSLNGKEINIVDDVLLVVVNKILGITKEFDGIDKIKVNEDSDVIVVIDMTNIKKNYRFIGEVPANMNKLYSLIRDLEEMV